MQTTTLLQRSSMVVTDHRCPERTTDAPYPEHHERFSIAYVRKGTFGYHVRGRSHALVAGSILVGNPGDDYRCTHDHGGGDECLSFRLSDATIAAVGDPASWEVRSLPPIAELVVIGELAQAVVRGESTLALDEVGLLLLARFARFARAASSTKTVRAASFADRKRAVRAAQWIEANASSDIDLASAAAEARLSPLHFLRVFTRSLGVTPHQHLVRARLRHAARLLLESDAPITQIALDVGFNDLSNFVRTFGRAAGRSPRSFRRARIARARG